MFLVARASCPLPLCCAARCLFIAPCQPPSLHAEPLPQATPENAPAGEAYPAGLRLARHLCGRLETALPLTVEPEVTAQLQI